MNALLRTTIHSLWLGKYSRVLPDARTRPLRPPRHGAQPCLRGPPFRAPTHSGVSSPSPRIIRVGLSDFGRRKLAECRQGDRTAWAGAGSVAERQRFLWRWQPVGLGRGRRARKGLGARLNDAPCGCSDGSLRLKRGLHPAIGRRWRPEAFSDPLQWPPTRRVRPP